MPSLIVKLGKRKLLRSYTRFLIACLLFSFVSKAQSIEFIENKGQWDNRVKFKGDVATGAFFIRNTGGFTVVQNNLDDIKLIDSLFSKHANNSIAEKKSPLILRSHSWDVDFVDADSKNMQVIPDKGLNTVNNYYIGNDPSKWANACKIYQGITVKNVYPNIDVRYYTSGNSLKYDIIAKPGADISKIALRYKGADKLQIKKNELVIGTSVGERKESMPYSFIMNEKGRQEINCKYILKGDVVSFDVKNYDGKSTLVIDPSLVFCSFSGSTASNWGFTATYGPDGSMFGGGIVFGTGFPVTSGAAQTTFNGGSGMYDIGIIKLTPDGKNRVYATYLGGSGKEMPHSLICDGQGNLIMAGKSESSNYPTMAPNTFGTGGGFDIVVTKLNTVGGMIGSVRIGGSGQDGANISTEGGSANSLERNYGDESRSEVILDAAGNIWLASCTQSTNFPLQNAFQAANNGGAHGQDGVILSLNSNLTALNFSTYIGGNGDDAAYVLSFNPQTGNLYVAGGTASDNFPGNKAGTIGTTFNGSVDGFIAQLSGTSLVRTTYIGTSGIDQIYGIQFDDKGFPYITGQTSRGDIWPVLNATYVNAGAPQFIGKLQPNLSGYVYSTLFGKASASPNISPTAFLVDRCENVYVSGWGGGFGPFNSWTHPSSGTFGLPVTPDAIKSTTDGRDFYFFVLKKNASAQLYGSFFGEDNIEGCDHVDGGTSRFDRNGTIYQGICANCKGLDPGAVFPTTPGVWSPVNPAGNAGEGGCNLAMLKINFNLAGVAAGVQSAIDGVIRDTAGCVPLRVDFKDTIAIAQSYEWHFGDGSPTGITNHPDTFHIYNTPGTYQVMLVAIDSATCNIRDTSYMRIRVGTIKANLAFDYIKRNPCDSFRFEFFNQSNVPNPFAFTDSSFVWDFGDGTPPIKAGLNSIIHDFPAAGPYNVTLRLVDTIFCNAPDDTIRLVSVSSFTRAQFTTPPTGCAPYNATFKNTSIGGQTYLWDFGDGGTSTDFQPVHLYSNPGTYTIRLTASNPNTCNQVHDTTFTITVGSLPTAEFSNSPIPPIENTPTIFTNLSSLDAIKFVWRYGDGDTLFTTSRNNVSHQYNKTGTFSACLEATNSQGCTDSVCHPVVALVFPVVDVPNAFTPMSGDVNSKVFVRGFGITKLRFIIWNRWGQKVFETNDKSIGWDGRVGGVVQPMDAYAYTLEVEFFDGQRVTKKGDITLIR